MRVDRRLLTLAFGGLFWRTFLLIALLIAVSLAAWFQSFRVIEREPRAQRVALQLVAIVKLTRTALLYSDPDLRRALLQDLESNEGVRVYPREPSDKYQLQPDESLNRLIEIDVRGRLGNETVIAQSVNDIPGVWISFKIDDDDYWVALDRDQLDNVTGLQWLGWGIFALALSLFGAAFITSLVNRPFARLALAARKLGSGQVPDPLPERGMGVAAETNRSFNQMVRDLEQLEADRAVMLAGISHDLRTPLARLRLETEMSPADILTKDAMVDDIEQMDRIIGRFLDYARPAQRTAEVVDLSALVREIAGRMASEDGVDLTLELADRALIEGDSTDMRRVIANLLENARKYGKRSEEEIPQIRVATYAQHGQVDIFVSDRGPGIPEDQIALVTRPFYRVDAARTQADGTGLGMAIVLRLVSRHRGALRLRNRQPGPGLEVSLNFPEYRGPGRDGDLVRDVARDGVRDTARESKRDSRDSKREA
ncbi:Osmolarity sensor protein EnvZ [Pararobbsia alpina]|uniref:histidine kinase n=1 Tax=Pararobbsia alpina TaxID=621374 RepID=A0A6S7BZU8_9BURK|nr:Osmolarity sensor protein EnvZ [Pararobbsia alpina]